LTNRSAVHVLEIVPMSPAARAGVEIGDRLIAIDGAPINGIDDLQRLLDSTWIGRHCELTVLRRSSLVHLSLRPIEVPATGA
jgi:S1-C subfamily serine protease